MDTKELALEATQTKRLSKKEADLDLVQMEASLEGAPNDCRVGVQLTVETGWSTNTRKVRDSPWNPSVKQSTLANRKLRIGQGITILSRTTPTETLLKMTTIESTLRQSSKSPMKIIRAMVREMRQPHILKRFQCLLSARDQSHEERHASDKFLDNNNKGAKIQINILEMEGTT